MEGNDHRHDPCAHEDADQQPERVHYYQGQLLTPEDLSQEQNYFRAKQRLHNRLLHGWGVVAGLEVMHGDSPDTIVVRPGLALDPCGNEILLPEDQEVEVAEALPPGGEADRVVHLAIRYAEVGAGPVHMPDDQDHFARVVETFDMALLSGLPDAYDPMPKADLGDAVSATDAARSRPFPPPSGDPWVVLADVVIRHDDTVASIDQWAHRRMVAAFGEFAFSG